MRARAESTSGPFDIGSRQALPSTLLKLDDVASLGSETSGLEVRVASCTLRVAVGAIIGVRVHIASDSIKDLNFNQLIRIECSAARGETSLRKKVRFLPSNPPGGGILTG